MELLSVERKSETTASSIKGREAVRTRALMNSAAGSMDPSLWRNLSNPSAPWILPVSRLTMGWKRRKRLFVLTASRISLSSRLRCLSSLMMVSSTMKTFFCFPFLTCRMASSHWARTSAGVSPGILRITPPIDASTVMSRFRRRKGCAKQSRMLSIRAGSSRSRPARRTSRKNLSPPRLPSRSVSAHRLLSLRAVSTRIWSANGTP